MCTSKFPDTSIHEQLPRNVTPLHYRVECFEINQTNNTFKGKTLVKFNVNETTKAIFMNQKMLNFTTASATQNGSTIDVTDIVKDDQKETVQFSLARELSANTDAQLLIEYEGSIRSDMAGFYSSTYESPNGTEYILATQFESTDARSAFPCYDEPNCKANFEIVITVDESVEVLSNMPLKSTTPIGNNKTFEFVQTPKMSTYLVAWAIGKFEYVESTTVREYNGRKLPIRVYTVPGQSHTGYFALEVAQKAVDYLSTVFDIDYPLPKLDLLAVPQFGANAMENWGLVTFRATALLFDPEKSNALYKQKVTYVVSHEIAHSWFGNYCTMNWWSDLWLNESFATFVGWLCVEHIYKEWDVFTDFVTDSVQTALVLDGLRNSHPVEVQVYHASDIDEIFDAISYLKGGSVVRMIAEAIGVETFLKGVSNYLKKYSFGNAKSDDLWDAISDVSGMPVTKLVEPWIRAVGFPYLNVTKTDDGKINVTQSRFLSGGDVKDADDQIIWWIPNVDNMQSKNVTLSSEGFLKLNFDTTGFYRVVYDDEIFDNIVNNMEMLTSKDKIGLIADSAAAAQAGLTKTSQFLHLVSKLKNEQDVAVWMQIVQCLSSLKTIFYSNPEISSKLSAFSRDLYKSKFTQLINAPDASLSFGEQKLRSLLFTQGGLSQLPEAISKAQEIHQSGSIPPIFKSVVYKTLIANKETCTAQLVEEIIQEAKTPTSIDGREVALSALGSVHDVSYLPQIFDLFFDGSIPEMDFQFLTKALSSNAQAKKKFWAYFKNDWSKFRGEVSMWTLDRVIKGFLPCMVSESLFADIKTFFDNIDKKGFEKGVNQGIDAISNAVSWAERSNDDVLQWLADSGY
ncbi:hypothetical protein DAMA08_050670 [Martiniozyma asiatica (nom. inval.)]|nr:hypothetical protein DAMA08_050670 [Martiniozyma asiatica]